MQIRLEVPRARLRRWHQWLIDHLQRRTGARISITITDSAAAEPSALRLLLQLESLTATRNGLPGSELLNADEVAKLNPATTEDDADIVVRFGEQATGKTAATVFDITFDGVADEDALWLALLDRRAPQIAVTQRTDDGNTSTQTCATGLPGLEAPHIVSASADAVFSRTIELIAQCIEKRAGYATAAQADVVDVDHRTPTPSGTLHIGMMSSSRFLARRVKDKARSVLEKITHNAPHWQVAWRPRQPINPAQATELDLSQYHILPDDRRRYYADPFPITIGDETHVFVEEFQYSTGLGLISSFIIRADGTTTEPRLVLAANVHLSYPQVFCHGEEIWLMPEASAMGGVDLYRADNFPTGWVHVARLIDEPLHDATIHFDGQRWWIFAASQFLKSSSWCALRVFHSDDLLGPWQAISSTPVKIDARSARPAGVPIIHDGTLWRPTQNCSTGYGHGLTWCRLDSLSPDHFAETACGTMQFKSTSQHLGPHTWTTSKSIETVDFFAKSQA